MVAVELHLYKPKDADSIYILRFTRKNDFRVSYISQRTSLGYGTKVEGTKVNMAMYNNVIVDLVLPPQRLCIINPLMYR